MHFFNLSVDVLCVFNKSTCVLAVSERVSIVSCGLT